MSQYETTLVSSETYEIVGRVRGLPVLKTYSHDTGGQLLVILYVYEGTSTRFLWTRVSGDDDPSWIRERMQELESLDRRLIDLGFESTPYVGRWRLPLSRKTLICSIVNDYGALVVRGDSVYYCETCDLYERVVALMRQEAELEDFQKISQTLRDEMARLQWT